MMKFLDKIGSAGRSRIRGVIHVGANDGEEYDDYKKAGIEHQIWIEPLDGPYERLIKRLPSDNKILTFKVACGDKAGRRAMYVMEGPNGHDYSSSILYPKAHLNLHPDIAVVGMKYVDVVPLDDLILKHGLDFRQYNLLVADVQGFELQVIRGGKVAVSNADYIICEINREEVYAGCAMVEDIDLELQKAGFFRYSTDWCGPQKSYGDALYIRSTAPD